MNRMKLLFHKYKYYPYERQLALREASALLGGGGVKQVTDGLELTARPSSDSAERLVYFSQIHNGKVAIETVQARLERAGTAVKRRQATRYSVHGLHEYKGKFNPQIGKAILNIFGVRPGDHVFDPFCGSGTTLIECGHVGARASGIDRNPLAIFIANAKLQALATRSDELISVLERLSRSLLRNQNWSKKPNKDERSDYLRSWFDGDTLSRIEIIKEKVASLAGELAPIFLCIASNLLRDYSQQDPNDLRIRRRTSPLPSQAFHIAFLDACQTAFGKLAEAQRVLGPNLPRGEARLGDSSVKTNIAPLHPFDAALTSPPYAMALPYIDTQRLSLIWLGLVEAREVLPLEAKLIGSREMRGESRRLLKEQLGDNGAGLPKEQYDFCKLIQSRLSDKDGFRRQAMPSLLYRYFVDMLNTFGAVRGLMKKNAPYALIVGHNHTILSGVRCDIDTPRHLTSLAVHAGWKVEELIGLQTYQRYGYHMDNAVAAETLILLRNQ